MAVAQSFEVAQLSRAGLVRPSVLEVSLADLGVGGVRDENASVE